MAILHEKNPIWCTVSESIAIILRWKIGGDFTWQNQIGWKSKTYCVQQANPQRQAKSKLKVQSIFSKTKYHELFYLEHVRTRDDYS